MRWIPALLAVGSLATVASCGTDLPLAPVNRSPSVQSLTARLTSLAPGESTVVVCRATDPDGDLVVFDWSAYNVLTIRGALAGSVYNRGDTIVVHALSGSGAPVDTGWVACFVRDGRGGGADAGHVPIIVLQ